MKTPRRRCQTCSSSHRPCDKAYPHCGRCSRLGLNCSYNESKAFRIPCDRCISMHKKCDMNDGPNGCSRCRRSGAICVYNVTPSASSSLVLPTPVKMPATQTDSVLDGILHMELGPLSPPTEIVMAPSQAEPTEMNLSRLPTFEEWTLVFSFMRSPQAQELWVLTLLDKDRFLSNFFSRPLSLWYAVCAHAVLQLGADSSTHINAPRYYEWARNALDQELIISTTPDSVMACMLLSDFAFVSLKQQSESMKSGVGAI
ncbi:hypothetical protein BC830DRAFT_1233778 [Chytriomyces sp. MP71]|nr:hypothetical protein BC830DRAFT_1222897 [Chytriomyces sp. MP71]KAI8608788.1 hypothetical protein BC830DRAFT_1233778 [Chytriomyces sp. MP71]